MGSRVESSRVLADVQVQRPRHEETVTFPLRGSTRGSRLTRRTTFPIPNLRKVTTPLTAYGPIVSHATRPAPGRRLGTVFVALLRPRGAPSGGGSWRDTREHEAHDLGPVKVRKRDPSSATTSTPSGPRAEPPLGL